MIRIPINTEIDSQTLLKNVATLSIKELEAFAKELNTLIQQRKKQEHSNKEKKLLNLLNRTVLSKAEQDRILELSPKVALETISVIEKKELTTLLAQSEALRNKRVEMMISLSKLKGITLPEVMQQLGLISLRHV